MMRGSAFYIDFFKISSDSIAIRSSRTVETEILENFSAKQLKKLILI